MARPAFYPAYSKVVQWFKKLKRGAPVAAPRTGTTPTPTPTDTTRKICAMANQTSQPETLRVADLSAGRGTCFTLAPDEAARADLAASLGIREIGKLRFEGALQPDGRRDWRLEAHLGATVVQSCVVTLEPVVTRIERDITRRFLADPAPLPEQGEVEMPEDDSTEPLGQTIELGAVMAEALALALPDYPRAEGAELPQTQSAPPGVAPLHDDDLRPFAGLADLKRKLEQGD